MLTHYLSRAWDALYAFSTRGYHLGETQEEAEYHYFRLEQEADRRRT